MIEVNTRSKKFMHLVRRSFLFRCFCLKYRALFPPPPPNRVSVGGGGVSYLKISPACIFNLASLALQKERAGQFLARADIRGLTWRVECNDVEIFVEKIRVHSAGQQDTDQRPTHQREFLYFILIKKGLYCTTVLFSTEYLG
jgi:hypothetical protein